MAAEYGWTARAVEQLTDELLVLYLDSAADRIGSRAQAEFDTSVEAVRVGTIFAHDGKQHARWMRSRTPKRPALSEAALEAAIVNIARMFPENVVRGTV